MTGRRSGYEVPRAVMKTTTDKGYAVARAGGPRMSRARRLLAGLLAAGVLLAATAGCAQSVDPIERLGRKAAQKVQGPHRAPAAESGPKAGARGDLGAPGSWAGTACGRRDRPQESADSRPSPSLKQRQRSQGRPESYGAVDPGAGCERQ
ncbi:MULTISPECIES: hypothetical protein [unclassified Streptomyces]|uniref:hypothetical protein n=1 Tax=unclassified Streptomyces TaxID=2593676 RepID=UPI003641679A